MTCVQEIENVQRISTSLLCVQLVFVIIFLILSKEKRAVDLVFLGGLFLFHPLFHKSITDCGKELFLSSILYLCTTFGLCIGFWYRSRILENIKGP